MNPNETFVKLQKIVILNEIKNPCTLFIKHLKILLCLRKATAKQGATIEDDKIGVFQRSPNKKGGQILAAFHFIYDLIKCNSLTL